MTKQAEDLFDKLSLAVLNLTADGHLDLAKRLGETLNALSSEDFVLALIIAKINHIPRKICDAIQETYQIKDVD